MRQIIDAPAGSLVPFVQESVEPGGIIHTDGWLGYLPLERHGYQHDVTFLRGKKKRPSELMPRVHRVISLLKRWLIGTHQGAVSRKHLDYYLDEFTFRFNRRRSKSAANSSSVWRSKPSQSSPFPWTGSFTQKASAETRPQAVTAT
jgi:transposase-like protein